MTTSEGTHQIRRATQAPALERAPGLETKTSAAYVLIRISVAIVYLWFGALKFPFVPGGSPAEAMVGTWSTVIDTAVFLWLLAIAETAAGVMLLFGWKTRVVAMLLIGHVIGTFATPLVDPSLFYNAEHGFHSLTVAGQYVVKNVLIIGCCVALIKMPSKTEASIAE